MKTLKEMIKVMEHFDNGGEVEEMKRSMSKYGWMKATKPGWDWGYNDYRIKEEPKPDWLKTGWVKDKDGGKYIIIGYKKDSKEPYLLNYNRYSEEEMKESYTPCESPIGK